MPFDGSVLKGVVYRLKKEPQMPTEYPYLVMADNIGAPADVVTINEFHRIKETLKKKVKKGTGLEILVAPARKMDASGVAHWLADIRELNTFCLSSECQLILSSGATSKYEMISGLCLDSILTNCDLDPQTYWREMNRWLETKILRRVAI